jgi:hypothetical protein
LLSGGFAKMKVQHFQGLFGFVWYILIFAGSEEPRATLIPVGLFLRFLIARLASLLEHSVGSFM